MGQFMRQNQREVGLEALSAILRNHSQQLRTVEANPKSRMRLCAACVLPKQRSRDPCRVLGLSHHIENATIQWLVGIELPRIPHAANGFLVCFEKLLTVNQRLLRERCRSRDS